MMKLNLYFTEIVRAFTHVINNGQAMYWGTSRWSPMEIMEAYSVARQFNLIPPIAEQAEYHLFQREKVELQMPELYHKIGGSDCIAKIKSYWHKHLLKCSSTPQG